MIPLRISTFAYLTATEAPFEGTTDSTTVFPKTKMRTMTTSLMLHDTVSPDRKQRNKMASARKTWMRNENQQ
jgi:hypothetical protein